MTDITNTIAESALTDVRTPLQLNDRVLITIGTVTYRGTLNNVLDFIETNIDGANLSGLRTDNVEEDENFLYHTGSRVLGTVLAGLSLASGVAVVDTDSVLIGIGKLQKQINNFPSTILNTVLTGIVFTSAADVLATDSILVALGKLQKKFTDLGDSFLSLVNARWGFKDVSTTTYTLILADLTANGRMIISLTNNSFTTLSLPTPTSLGVTVGDSVQVMVTGTYAAQTLATSGSTAIGTLAFSAQYHTKTIIAKTSTSWLIIG